MLSKELIPRSLYLLLFKVPSVLQLLTKIMDIKKIVEVINMCEICVTIFV
jgi:hypothetical protein